MFIYSAVTNLIIHLEYFDLERQGIVAPFFYCIATNLVFPYHTQSKNELEWNLIPYRKF